ncbi:protein O-mannosyl-transferase family [Planctomycetota bacterium]
MKSEKLKLAQRYGVILCAALVFYVISCAPGALWQDSGLIQYRIRHNDMEGFFGLALSHPLFYIVAMAAKYIPFGEFTHKVNMVSAIAGAVAIANLYLLVRLWLGKDMPAIIAAITLAVSHTFWRHASIIETYTLWTALFLAELIVLLQYARTNRARFLYWLGFLNGLAIAVHMLASIPFICYAVFIIYLLAKKEIHIKNLGIIILFWIVGALPYEYLIAGTIIQTGDVTGTLASAAFGTRWRGAVLNTSMSIAMVRENLCYILFNFPTPNFLLFFVGGFALFKTSPGRAFRNIFFALMALFFVFAFRYTVPDRYAFFLPFYVIASILIGLGAHFLLDRMHRKALAFLILFFSLLPIGIYAAAPTIAGRIQLNIGTRDDIPYRQDDAYFLRPWKTGYRAAERFADEALDLVADQAIIYADATTVAPLLLAQQIKGKRPDVTIISGTVNSNNAPPFSEQTMDTLLENRTIYVVSRKPGYCPAFVLEHYDLIPAGILWKVATKEKQ